MKKYIFALFTFLIYLFGQTAAAVEIPTLYQGEVAVASTSPADWQKALPQALAQVLLKVSMNPNVLQISSIAKSLNKGTNLVQSYNYTAPDTTVGRSQMLQVRFSPKGINQLLQAAGQTPFSKQRPLTLVWIVQQNGANQPKVINSDKINLQKAADLVAMPILWPTPDAQDLAALPIEQLWSLNQTAIQQASQRYHADNILVGKVSKQGNIWQAQWLSITASAAKPLQTQGSSVKQAFVEVVAKLGRASVQQQPATLLNVAAPSSPTTPPPAALPANNAPSLTSPVATPATPVTDKASNPPKTEDNSNATKVPVIDESLVVIPPGASNGVAQSFPTDDAPAQFVPDTAPAPPAAGSGQMP